MKKLFIVLLFLVSTVSFGSDDSRKINRWRTMLEADEISIQDFNDMILASEVIKLMGDLKKLAETPNKTVESDKQKINRWNSLLKDGKISQEDLDDLISAMKEIKNFKSSSL